MTTTPIERGGGGSHCIQSLPWIANCWYFLGSWATVYTHNATVWMCTKHSTLWTYLRALHMVTAFILLYRRLAVGTWFRVGHQPETVSCYLSLIICTTHCKTAHAKLWPHSGATFCWQTLPPSSSGTAALLNESTCDITKTVMCLSMWCLPIPACGKSYTATLRKRSGGSKDYCKAHRFHPLVDHTRLLLDSAKSQLVLC